MHRNTYILVTVLAIFAALLVGVNLGRKLSPTDTAVQPKPTPKPLLTLPVIPTITSNTYTNITCGITLQYPNTLVKLESTGSALFVDGTTQAQAFAVACQKDIPRPPIPATKIETKILTNNAGSASISAKLYHDASAKDGAQVDELIFRNPKTGVDTFIAGFGNIYNEVISSVKLLP
jgi:hypothetical protein